MNIGQPIRELEIETVKCRSCATGRPGKTPPGLQLYSGVEVRRNIRSTPRRSGRGWPRHPCRDVHLPQSKRFGYTL